MDQVISEVELSRPLDVSDLPSQGRFVVIEASPAEGAALCRRFGLVDLCALTARVQVKRGRSKEGERAIHVQASFCAEVVQKCVVTLESFTVNVDEKFEIYFVPSADLSEGEGVVIDLLDDDASEPLHVPEVDLGELVAQHMALTLDPYPRRPGAVVNTDVDGVDDAELAAESNNPFAILGQLKHKM